MKPIFLQFFGLRDLLVNCVARNTKWYRAVESGVEVGYGFCTRKFFGTGLDDR